LAAFPRLAAFLCAVMLAMAVSIHAEAVEPDEILADPALETRARDISRGLRCLVCQNQSIDDSNAELARDLRILVRDRLVAGDSDEAVVSYVVSRYGEFVLLKPPFHAGTYALWLGPAVIFAFGGIAVILFYVRRRRQGAGEAPPPLSEAEQRRLSALLSEKRP
jgi:cytochrome c-type biogenesis protein CcmH